VTAGGREITVPSRFHQNMNAQSPGNNRDFRCARRQQIASEPVQEGKRLGPIGQGFEDDEEVGVDRHVGHHAANAEDQIGGGRIIRDEALQASIEPMPQNTSAKFAIMHKEQ
jgi:hypothetical protein